MPYGWRLFSLGGARMHGPVEHFRLAIAAAGATLPDKTIADGDIHRFSTNNKRGDDSGWNLLHSDGLTADAFGCWRAGLKSTWCVNSDRAMLCAESEAHRQRIKA